MKETTDHLDNIVDIIFACRKLNSRIGARLRHYYSGGAIVVHPTGRMQIAIPLILAENGISELNKKAIEDILNTLAPI
jgi:hypothetical protein